MPARSTRATPDAIDAATSNDELLAALLAVWRETRSPRVADAIERLAPPDKEWLRIAKKPGSRARAAIGLLAKNVDDPRLASLYVTWLELGQWPAPPAKELWARVFAPLATLDDSRVVGRLLAVARALPPFVGAAHRAWMIESIDRVARSISKPKADSQALAAALERVFAKLGPAPQVAKPEASMIEAVWADPEDHELKQVVADALLEREDPRGEFITIQLRGTSASAAERKRGAELESKHALAWLGAIGKIVTRGHWRFEHGFPALVAIRKRLVPRRDWEAALKAPEWATIHTLRFSILTTPKWWVTEWVRSPATRHVRAFEWAGLKDDVAAFRMERAPDRRWRLAHVQRRYRVSATKWFEAFVEGLDASERAQVVAQWQAK